eukprot:3203521-Rhodomonas_salina.6
MLCARGLQLTWLSLPGTGRCAPSARRCSSRPGTRTGDRSGWSSPRASRTTTSGSAPNPLEQQNEVH